MWRQISDNPDSDRSISDEEEFDRRFPENCIALGDRKDDFACFSRNASMLHSEEEMISSDDEESRAYSMFSVTSRARDSQKASFHSIKNKKQGQADTWQSISEEADALVRANERASSSNTNKHHKGDKGKVKPKFSILPRSYKDEVSWQSFPENGDIVSSKHEHCIEYKTLEPSEGMKEVECRNLHNSTIEFFDDLEEDSDRQPVTSSVSVGMEAVECGCKPSVAELLDGLQDKSGPLGGNSEKSIRNKERNQLLVVKRGTATLGERIIDGEDPPETMSSSSTSESENLQLVMPEITRQTMAEMFQEVFGFMISSDEGVLLPAPKPQGTGLFGKLQQIVLAEKDKDAHFLTTILTRDKQFDEATCIDVRILSRYLEAKLIICRCEFSNKREYPENTKAVAESDLIERSVIFNPRVCGDIEVEVGSMIRIHPPWKEVTALTNGEKVILCTYFSQIL